MTAQAKKYVHGKQTSNSSAHVTLVDRFVNLYDLFQMYRAGGAYANEVELVSDFDQIDAAVKRCIGKQFEDCRAVEIGFGAKPYRIQYFSARGVDVYGIDLDRPLAAGSLAEILRIARENGVLRAAKTATRFFLFDRPARRVFQKFIDTAIQPQVRFDRERLMVGDASDPFIWSRIPFRPDIIFSFRVFEHIPPKTFEALLDEMQKNICPGGLVFLIITVYTGLIGNHLTEWYPHRIDLGGKRSEPWEHLRKNRHRADTYLNEFTRRDYRRMFESRFEVLVDEPIVPAMGAEFLTEDLKRELHEFDEYELLSNDVLFLLRAPV